MKGRKRLKKRWQMPMYEQHVKFGIVRLHPINIAALVQAINNPQLPAPEVIELARRYNQEMRASESA